MRERPLAALSSLHEYRRSTPTGLPSLMKEHQCTFVVMAYGTARVTKKAVRRAHDLKGGQHKVMLVAASPAGAAAIANLNPTDKVASSGRSGLAEAFGALTDEPTLLIHDDAVEILAPLAAKDPSSTFIEPVIRSFPVAAFADSCIAFPTAGGSNREATRVGLLAAAMADGDAAFAALASQETALDPQVRSGSADKISSNGRPDLAARLLAA